MVVLAGKNNSKMTTIARLTAAGIHCLGDKPWVTSLDALPALQAATPSPSSATGLAMDIMTTKHDVVAKLRREIVRDDSLFGCFRADDDLPSIEIGSVHHLAKLVNGSPLQRPTWYYNVGVQGNGLVDVYLTFAVIHTQLCLYLLSVLCRVTILHVHHLIRWTLRLTWWIKYSGFWRMSALRLRH